MKRSTIATIVIFLVVVAGVYIKREEYSKVEVRLNYEKVEEGKYSNGEAFSEQDFIKESLIKEVYLNYEFLKGVDYNEFLTGFEVGYGEKNQVKKAEELLKDNKKYNLNPSQIFIEFESKALTQEQSEKVLKKLMELYKQEEIEKKVEAEGLGESYLVSYEDYYDLDEKLYELNKKVEMAERFLDRKRTINETKYLSGYENLLVEMNFFKKINIQKVATEIKITNVVLNYDMVYSQKVEKLKALTKSKAIMKREMEMVEEMLKNYKPDADRVLLSTGQSTDSIDINREKDYYTKLIEQATSVSVKIVKTEEEIKYVEEELKDMQENKVMSLIIEDKLDKLAVEQNERIEKMNELVKTEKALYYNDYMKVGEVEWVSTFSLKKTGLIAFLASLAVLGMGMSLEKKMEIKEKRTMLGSN